MMNIQNISSTAYGVQTFKPAEKGTGKEVAPPKAPAVPSEQVELSAASINLKKLRDAMDELPEIRIKLVEEIRQKIKMNGYPFESDLYRAVEKLVENNVI